MSGSPSKAYQVSFPRRLVLLVLIPVLITTVALSVGALIAITRASLRYIEQTDASSIRAVSGLALQIAERGFEELLASRLSRDSRMVETVKVDSVKRIGDLATRFPGIRIAVVDLDTPSVVASDGPGPDLVAAVAAPYSAAADAVWVEGPEPALARWEHFPFYRWAIVAYEPRSAMIREAEAIRRAAVPATVGAMAILVVAILIIFRRLVERRLNAVAELAARVGAGAYPEVDIERRDEIGMIREAFRDMVARLADQRAALDRAIESLTHREERFRRIVESTSAGYFRIDRSGIIRDVNQATAELFGFKHPNDLIGRQLEDFTSAARDPDYDQAVEQIDRGLTVHSAPLVGRTINGEPRYVAFSAVPVFEHGAHTGAEGFLIDTTRLREARIHLEQSLREKEVLLQEVHHRVRNNLNVVISLLHLQLGVSSPDQRAALHAIASRVMSIALAHSMVHEVGRYNAIDASEYIGRVASETVQNSGSRTPVLLDLELQRVDLSLDTAVTVGLLCTEAVMNVLRHAFGDRRDGSLRIVYRLTDRTHELTIADDGVGLECGRGRSSTCGLGLQVMDLLAQQLDGSMEIRSDGGTTVTVRFPDRQPVSANVL